MERRAKLGVLGNELLGMYMHRGHVQTEERETRRRNGCAAEELKKVWILIVVNLVMVLIFVLLLSMFAMMILSGWIL
jgi:hypothetical protein